MNVESGLPLIIIPTTEKRAINKGYRITRIILYLTKNGLKFSL